MFGFYSSVFTGLGTFWNIVDFMELNGAKPVAEQMKRRQSRYTEEVSVDTHPWCRSTPNARSFEGKIKFKPKNLHNL